LKEVAHEPNITIQIVPFEYGTHRGMIGQFTALEFAKGDGDTVINIEDAYRTALIRDDPKTTSKYLEMFRELEEFAAGPDQVDAIVDSVMETMRHKP
jgi:hypothetical protein